MAKKPLPQVLAQNRQLGFGDQIIEIAYANVDGDSDRVLQEIFRLQDQSNKFPTKPSNPQDEDAQLSKAIQMSMTEAKDKKISLQPLNPEQRVRKSGVPVGLKNIGNTCYFNSILQTYFQNVNLVRTILNYQIPQKYKQKSDGDQQKINQEDGQFKRKQASCRLVQNLKHLFAGLIASDRKYLDPTDVISSVVDDYGNELIVGDQKDIGQFNLVFLSRIDEGLQLSRKESQMDIEEKGGDVKEDSPSKIKIFGDEKLQQLSLLNRSSIKIQQNSLINEQFIGKMQNYFSNEKQNIHKQQQQLFSLLFVNVANGQLYKALQQITIQHIDDYRNEKGQVIGVQKQSWIKKAPKTLFFQIDRVVFNKQKSVLEKINDQFDFPQTFYIDPFLSKNKEKALSVQKKVKQLRQDKQKYKNALKQFQKYGEKSLNLFDMLEQTTKFLGEQNSFMETENQIDNPLYFSALKSSIKPEHLKLMGAYKESIKSRMDNYRSKVESIDKEIESCYASIRSTPYYLYSILIHEGSADSGHYYSYTYDIINKNWKKYNDINISQEVQNQVMKQARGVNYTSAYYLVYAQQQVLCPPQVNKSLRNNVLSKQETYLDDFYSTLVPKQVINKVKQQNEQLYLEIQQFKMGAFANRVVDSYTKKFQMCNEVHRKTKVDKKKNSTPPLLTNFPIYLKDSVNEETYRNGLIQNCIHEYGPKEYSPIFQDLVKKKIANFNDFKKPKKLQIDSKLSERFIHNIFRAQCAKKLFQILNNQQYNCLFSLMKELRGGERGDYFDWISNLICKILIVRLLMEGQKEIKNPELSIKRLELLVAIMFSFINMDEEKALVNNCIQWMIQLSIQLEGQNKAKLQTIFEFLQNRKYGGEYDFHLKSHENDPLQEIKKATDYTDVMWNLSRTQNTFINAINDARQEVKNKMKVANELYSQMKKQNLPLKTEQRNSIQQKAQK